MPLSFFGKCALAVPLLATVLANLGAAWAGPALLFDPADGLVLYAEDQDDAWHPASLTKMMTAYLTFEALKQGKITLATKFPVSELAHTQPPSKIGWPIGSELDVEHALQALIVKSANDVAVVLAEGIAGTHDAFIERMNTTAKRLGMTRTLFINPNGLPAPEQVTTARDLAKLTRAILTEYPQYTPMWSLNDIQVGRVHIRTHNQLLKAYDGADGMKTGFTCDSGYNVVATATRDGHKLAAVILGEPSGAARSLRAANLLEHGFQYRAWQGVLQPVTLETLELPPDINAVATSVRQFVPGPSCGGRHERTVDKVKARKKKLTMAQQKADAVAKAVVPITVPANKPAAAASPAVAPKAVN